MENIPIYSITGFCNIDTQKRTKIKRGKGHKAPLFLNIFSTNAAGLKSKILNFKNEIKQVDASIFTIQETHFVKKGKFVMEGYEIFEAIRKKKDGGTLIGAHTGPRHKNNLNW